MFSVTRRGFAGLLVACATTAPARAEDSLASPTDKPILTVSGQITRTNAEGSAKFDRAMLEGLQQDEFQTTTPWYTGPVTFDGVKMSRLMEAVGARGTTVTAVALNDYTTDLPMSDFDEFGVLLAIKRDGAYMPVRDKGPLFIVYPFDSAVELRSQKYYSRAAWQVAKLIVK